MQWLTLLERVTFLLQRLRQHRTSLRSHASAFNIAAAALCVMFAVPFACLLLDAAASADMVAILFLLLCCR